MRPGKGLLGGRVVLDGVGNMLPRSSKRELLLSLGSLFARPKFMLSSPEKNKKLPMLLLWSILSNNVIFEYLYLVKKFA